MIMMETMKDLHKRVTENKEETGMIRGVEVVRTGIPDLTTLPQWSAHQGPLQLGDWLLTLEPIVADLSASSELWWSMMIKASEQWYQRHMAMSPLDRVQDDVRPPAEVSVEKRTRLERRMAAMLLQAVPETVKEELISARRLSVFGILTQLLLTYCPGGVLEKQTLLRNLEDPVEVASISDPPAVIRKWLRWKLRTQEIGAVTPDPAILLKGLNKLTKRVFEAHKKLRFRVSLARNSLGVDARPTDISVGQLATHLLAEIEQVALSEKRAAAVTSKVEPKIKSMDAEKGKQKQKEKSGEEEKPKMKCRFYLTDSGCRRGKECTLATTSRMRSVVATPAEAPNTLPQLAQDLMDLLQNPIPRSQGLPRPRGRKKEVVLEEESGVSSQSSQSEVVKDLLEEADAEVVVEFYKPGIISVWSISRGGEERKDVMERLQQQLKSMKTFKMKKLNVGNDVGLVDSGATHPLRPRFEGEDTELYPVVEVSLADGRAVRLKMSPGGAMILPSEAIEPIIPMGMLSQKLNCSISWDQGTMCIKHPQRRHLKVMMKGGCPHVTRAEALTLISELEDIKLGIPREAVEFNAEVAWMEKLAQQHPVLSSLPSHVKERLFVNPGDWSCLPSNRHSRKRWKRNGIMLHLYAGPDSGFTLRHALKQLGDSVESLVEVDALRGESHDMLSDHLVYTVG